MTAENVMEALSIIQASAERQGVNIDVALAIINDWSLWLNNKN